MPLAVLPLEEGTKPPDDLGRPLGIGREILQGCGDFTSRLSRTKYTARSLRISAPMDLKNFFSAAEARTDHLTFSMHNSKAKAARVTPEDLALARDQNWWGRR